jgi:hypothetical protein
MDAAGVGEADTEASLLPEAAGVIVACKVELSRSSPFAALSCAQGASEEVEGRREVESGVLSGAGAVAAVGMVALL